MKLRTIALWAFLAMTVQDLGGTAMVIAEAHFNALAAACCDQVQWMAGIIITVFGLGDLIRERRITKQTVVAFLSISAGNIIGTYTGVDLLGHLVTH